MSKPLCIDLFCGLGGWTEAFLAEGYRCIGFDIERHVYGDLKYPGELVLQDVLALDGRKFKDAAVIVASPPCQNFSYMAMPWKRAKQMAAECRSCPRKWAELTKFFWACFRIQREAGGVPLIVENVKGAQPWVGAARWHFGSFYLWGDVPALMPIVTRGGTKIAGQDWNNYRKTGEVSAHWRLQAESGVKVHGQKQGEKYAFTRGAVCDSVKNGGSKTWFGISHGVEYPNQLGNPVNGRKVNIHEGGPVPVGTGSTSWFFGNTKHQLRASSSGSNARKQASAMIAKIPYALASHIARTFHPEIAA